MAGSFDFIFMDSTFMLKFLCGRFNRSGGAYICLRYFRYGYSQGWTARANWAKIQLLRITKRRFSHPLTGERGAKAGWNQDG